MSTLALGSCSLWINTDQRQCTDDADCVKAGLGALCMDQVCVDADDADGDSSELGADCPDGSACTALMSSDADPSTCDSDADCSAQDKPRCLGTSCVSEQLADQWLCADGQSIKTSEVRYGFHLVEFLSGDPPKNVKVKACRNSDPGCESPVATFEDKDGEGYVQLVLPTNFFGFFDIQSDVMPTLLYVTKPIGKNTQNRDLPLLAASTVELTANLASTEFDPDQGIVFLEALDCSDTPQGGIHFSAESGTSFYLVNQLPDTDAQETVYDTTNNTADGGFINVDPGFISFGASLGVDGVELGTFNAQVRASTVTFIDMHF